MDFNFSMRPPQGVVFTPFTTTTPNTTTSTAGTLATSTSSTDMPRDLHLARAEGLQNPLTISVLVTHAPPRYRPRMDIMMVVAPLERLQSSRGQLARLYDGTPAWFLHGTEFYVDDDTHIDARVFVRSGPDGARIELPLRDEKGNARFPLNYGRGIGWPALTFESWVRTGGHGVVARVRPAVAWLNGRTSKPVTPASLWAAPASPHGDPWTLKIALHMHEAREEFEHLTAAHQRLYLTGRGRRHIVAPVAYFVLPGTPPIPTVENGYSADEIRPFQYVRAEIEAKAKQSAVQSPYVGYLLTSYANGGPIGRARLEEKVVPDLLFQLWFTLAGLHLSGILHGDLSANNVLARWPSGPEWVREASRQGDPMPAAASVTYAVRSATGEGRFVRRPVEPTRPEVQLIDLGNSFQLTSTSPATQIEIRSPHTTVFVRPPEHFFWGSAARAYRTMRFSERSDTWAATLLSLQLGCTAGSVNDPFTKARNAEAAELRATHIMHWPDDEFARLSMTENWIRKQLARFARYQYSLEKFVNEYRKNLYKWRCTPPTDFIIEFLKLPQKTLSAVKENRALDPAQRDNQIIILTRQIEAAFGGVRMATLWDVFYVWNVVMAFGLPDRNDPHYGGSPVLALLHKYKPHTMFWGPPEEVSELRKKEPLRYSRLVKPGVKGMNVNGWVFDKAQGPYSMTFRQPTADGLPSTLDATGRLWTGSFWVNRTTFFNHRFFATPHAKNTMYMNAWATQLRKGVRFGQRYLPNTTISPRIRATEMLENLVIKSGRDLFVDTGVTFANISDATPDDKVWETAHEGGVIEDGHVYLPTIRRMGASLVAPNNPLPIVVGGTAGPRRRVNMIDPTAPQFGWMPIVPMLSEEEITDDPEETRTPVQLVSISLEGL